MCRNTFRRIFHSVFTQLLLICLVAGISIIFLVVGFFGHVFRQSAQLQVQKNVTQYLNYVVKDLGTPPNLERAREIAKESALQIRYEGPDGAWATSDSIPTLHEVEQEKLKRGHFSIYRFFHDKCPILLKQRSGAFVFVLKPEHTMVSGWEKWTILLTVLIISVVVMTFLAVRHILRPLKFLSEGVHHISNGNFDYQAPQWRSMEFDQLSEAFNTMTVRIRNMLHAKEQLLLDVSHELRSPLTRMKVALEMIGDAQVKESLTDDILEMEAMVSEILEAARLRNGAGELKVEAIPAKTLFKEIGELYQDQPPGLVVDPVPDDIVIHHDPMMIRIVLNNIISNAIKYSPVDGEAVRLSFRQDEEFTVVLVQDRGLGIPEEDMPYIFEPFYRVDKSRSKRTGGYGLGLSLCKTIMDAHGGKIEVQSTLGVGTMISLYFRRQITS